MRRNIKWPKLRSPNTANRQALMMKYTTTVHMTIAILSFLILSSVQFFLLYNTYELKNDHFYLAEQSVLNTDYSKVVANDKVMPGGQRIMDRYLVGDMALLEQTWNQDRKAFDVLAQKICDSAFLALRKGNNMDSLLAQWMTENHLNKNLEYVLLVERVDIAFEPNKYINLYDRGRQYPLIDPAIQTKHGIRIGGSLQEIAGRNMVSFYAVGSPAGHSTRVEFSFHVDIRNRQATIFWLMMPTFLLSLFSVLSVVLLFFITFRNWMRQKKLSEMKSDFINSITHEFHTPLSAIIVANKTMQSEKVISTREKVQPLTEVIQRQAERLRTLISQVLDITTMNRISLSREEFAIHNQLEEILLDYRLKLNGTNVGLNLQKDAEKDIVRADRFWFTTIILNILDNAVKYNQHAWKDIRVSTFDDKKSMYVIIRDNGIGMTDEIKKHVFEKFYRSMHSGSDSVKGLGLGLFYVKQAVDAHNWEIDITSVQGEGSTFTITIPF
jgi:two-component system, OmpR family, phosphate regulon sensor histidine kinase PhoR